MELSKLSDEDIIMLLQLLASLEDIENAKRDLNENIKPHLDRMNEILSEETKLNEMYQVLIDDRNSDDFKLNPEKLIDIVSKQKKLGEEKLKIDNISKGLYDELSEIVNQENEIISKIKLLIDERNNVMYNNSKYISSLTSKVYIVGSPTFNEVEIIDRTLSEIISSIPSLIVHINDVYSRNSIVPIVDNEYSNYKKLEELYLENKSKSENDNNDGLVFLQRNLNKETLDVPSKNNEAPYEKSMVDTNTQQIVNSNIISSSEVQNDLDSANEITKKDNNATNVYNENGTLQNQIENDIKIDINKVTTPNVMSFQRTHNDLDSIYDSINKRTGKYENKNVTESTLTQNNDNSSDIVSLDTILKTTNKDLIYLKLPFNNKYSKVANSSPDKLKNIFIIFGDPNVSVKRLGNNTVTINTDPITNFLNPGKAA
ncbi:MAG: hypothetical protein J6J17_00985 [Bacilli bacterium]|nr:hypothetical protein [Bacilli bacterium]